MSTRNYIPAEERTPQAMLEHFIADFYEVAKGDNPPGHFTAIRNQAVESAWHRGHRQGQQDGYLRALAELRAAQQQGWEQVQALLAKAE